MTIVRNTIKLDAYANVTVAAGTPAITKASSNVTSITDRAAGKFRINTTALASANYTITGMAINNDSIAFNDIGVGGGQANATTSFDIDVISNTSVYRDDSFYVMAAGA